MLGNENTPAMLYLLDTSTISQAFGSFNPGIFVSFWERFDALMRNGGVASVRLVRLELERAPKLAVVQSILRLENLNRDFFSDPTEQELLLVQEITIPRCPLPPIAGLASGTAELRMLTRI